LLSVYSPSQANPSSTSWSSRRGQVSTSWPTRRSTPHAKKQKDEGGNTLIDRCLLFVVRCPYNTHDVNWLAPKNETSHTSSCNYCRPPTATTPRRAPPTCTTPFTVTSAANVGQYDAFSLACRRIDVADTCPRPRVSRTCRARAPHAIPASPEVLETCCTAS